MAHKVGALTIPAPAPGAGEAAGAPMLDVLRDYFTKVIEAHIGNAWDAIAPGEPIVRVSYTYDPEELDFTERDLPVLCVWDDEGNPRREADGWSTNEKAVHILWVLPPTPQTKGSVRFPFFSAFSDAIMLAVEHGRDPSWVHDDDTVGSGASDDTLEEVAAYGSDVQKHAGIDRWEQRPIRRVPVTIEGARKHTYRGYMATLMVAVSTSTDAAAFGTHPTAIRFDINSGGNDPLVIQQALVPPDE